MDTTNISYPGYSSSMSQPVQFGGSIVQSVLPKVLTFASAESGNVVLYEINKLSILLTLPPGMELPHASGIVKSDKKFPTPHGDKSGYLFYKNNASHIDTLNKLFNGDVWQKELSEPLPQPVVPKDPSLLVRKTIMYNGRTMDISVWEYSDKSLAVFSPMDFSGGNERMLKPCRGLACTDSPSGKCDGYLIFKNNVGMISFLKQFIPDVNFEAMYKKSIPPSSSSSSYSSIPKEPQLLETKQIMLNGQEFNLEFYEYSELSVVLFPTPMISLGGDYRQTDNLKHPTQGPRSGYTIAKANLGSIESVCKYFGFSNIETLYTMKPEVAARSVAMSNTTVPQQSNLADMSIKTFDDIPIESLTTILRRKLVTSTGITCKEMLGDKFLVYGDEESVNDKISEMDDMSISIEIKLSGKYLVLLERDE